MNLVEMHGLCMYFDGFLYENTDLHEFDVFVIGKRRFA